MNSFIEVIDDLYFPKSLYPRSFYDAIPIAQAVVNHSGFLQILTDLFPTMNIQCVQELIHKGFKVGPIELKADMDAYACVYCGVPGREADYSTIYFNPLLLLSARKLEADHTSSLGKRPHDEHQVIASSSSSQPLPKSDVQVRLTMFFVIKIIHEISHIINFHCNLEMNDKMITSPKKMFKGSVLFQDFGEMIEFKLFGGVIEHREELTSALFQFRI